MVDTTLTVETINATVDGVPVTPTITGESHFFPTVTSTTAFVAQVQVRRNSDNFVFSFAFEKPAGDGTPGGQPGDGDTINPSTANAGPLPPTVSTGPSESDLLAEQQSFFTPLIMNHQSYNLVSGVGGNLNGLLNGQGLAPSISASGFAFQSTGYAHWLARRTKAPAAREEPKILELLAGQRNSKPAQAAPGNLQTCLPITPSRMTRCPPSSA